MSSAWFPVAALFLFFLDQSTLYVSPWNRFAISPREYEIDLRHACGDRLFETIFSAPALFRLFPDANSGETSHLEDSSSLISPFITMDVTISSPFNRSSIFSRRVRGYVCELKLSHIARYYRVSYSSRTLTAELISYLRFLDFKFFEPNSWTEWTSLIQFLVDIMCNALSVMQ